MLSRRGLEVVVGLEEAAHECFADAHEAEEKAAESESVGEHCDRGRGWMIDSLESFVGSRLRAGCSSFEFHEEVACYCAGAQCRRGRVFCVVYGLLILKLLWLEAEYG